MRCITTILIGGIFAFCLLLAPSASFAGNTTILGNFVHGGGTQFQRYTNEFGVREFSQVKQPGEIIQNIVAIILGVLGLIAVVMMMYAGFLWLTAGGEEERATQGRTLLFQAFIGLVIILSAYMVVYFVLRQLILAIAG